MSYQDKLDERIVCAAIKNRDTGLVICSPRHFDPIGRANMKALGAEIGNDTLKGWTEGEQGFVTQYWDFKTRKEAYIIAKKWVNL